jgi:hypothetical protein
LRWRIEIVKRELVFFFVILILGFLDWLTTVVGVLFCGATEVNPLFAGLTKSSLFVFSILKLTAVLFVAFAFYKGTLAVKSPINSWNFTKRFLYGGYSLTFLALTGIVGSNMIGLFRV